MTKRHRPAWMRVTPAVQTRAPYVPRSLKGHGRQAWRQLAPLLWRSGIATRLDLFGLEALCRCYGHWRVTLDAFESQGRPVELEAPLREWKALIRDWCNDFFLSPRSRAKAFDADPLEGIGRGA